MFYLVQAQILEHRTTAADKLGVKTRWTEMLPKLQSLSILLSDVTWKERFVAKCMDNCSTEDKNLIHRFSGDKLGGLRWESISNFCSLVPWPCFEFY